MPSSIIQLFSDEIHAHHAWHIHRRTFLDILDAQGVRCGHWICRNELLFTILQGLIRKAPDSVMNTAEFDQLFDWYETLIQHQKKACF